MKNNKYLFLFTLLYFTLGIINIHFALLGLICMGIPLTVLFTTKKKTWCQGYCPRSSLYTTCGRSTNKFSRKTPMFFVKGPMKWIMLSYFALSMTIIIATTIRVANGAPPMDYLRFLMVFPIKFFPQLTTISSPDWVLHFSYRFYSMMMTTTILGFIMALVYKPKTWCTICPINTVSMAYISSQNKK